MTHRPTGNPLRSVRPRPADAAPEARPPEPADTDPAVLAALLHRHGWQRRGGAPGRYGRWTPPGPGSGTSLLVPESRAFPDSEDLLAHVREGNAGQPSKTPSTYSTVGAGSQILRDLGVRRMRLMSSPVRFNAISGLDLEVVEYLPAE
ncbi:hypothetical protein ACPF8X_27570 [Streptomyces sp. G35A]